MNYKKRWISIFILVLVLLAVIVTGLSVINKEDDDLGFTHTRKETIRLWYTDEALTDYLLSRTVAFNDSHDYRVDIELVSGIEYLEKIYESTIHDADDAPDMFIITNDSLEKAYLAGLAAEITNTAYINDNNRFCQTARNAVTYKDKYVGYPFFVETAALLYNKTYLNEIAAEAEVSADALVPASIVDILTFADLYSAPENVEYFFKWDVSDIFYNYFFIGNYITVGGDSGDDENEVSIYNTESISSMMVYQEMNQFFSIDAADTNYASIMQDFIDGKTIYTVATSDCLMKLAESETEFEYGVAPIPDINSELETKGMSVTNALVVNAYSLHKDYANEFISFIYDFDDDCDLYAMAGKVPAWGQKEYINEGVEQFYNNYQVTTPISKLIKTSNFWIELEACFAKVWAGADANSEIKTLSEQIKSQISGVEYKEERLPDPEVMLLEAEEYVEE